MIHPAQPHRTPARLAFILLLLLASLILPQSASAQPDVSVRISLEEITPEFLTEDDALSFTGTVTTSGEDLEDVTIWWRMHTPVLTLETYTEWMDGDPELEPITFARHDLREPIPAGQQHSFDIEIPPESSPFDYGSPTGARGMELVVTGKTPGGRHVSDSVRSTILWLAADDSRPTPMTVAAPLTPTPEEWNAALSEQDPVAVHSSSRVVEILEELGRHDVTWGIDPALLDPTPINRLPELFSSQAEEPETPEPPAVLEWQEVPEVARIRALLKTQLGDSRLVSLGWAAPDHSTLVQGSEAGEELRDLNLAHSEAVFRSAGITPDPAATWSLVPLTMAEASRMGNATSVIVPPTREGSRTVPPTAQDVMIHSGRQELSDLLLESVPPHELRTRTLIHALSDTHLLATLPASIDIDDAANVASNLERLADLPWLDLGPLAPADVTGPLGGAPPTDATAGAGVDLTELASDLATLDSLAGITEEPERFRAMTNTPAFLAISSTWPESASQPLHLARAVHTAANADFLTIERPSTVNLISQGGDLPVGIENHSSIHLDPRVTVEPADARLLVEEQVDAHLGPQESTTVMVPITAVANGNVETTIHLLNVDGVQIARPETFTVRIRADWETTGTAIIAGVIAVAFGFGLVRNVRGTPRRHSGGS